MSESNERLHVMLRGRVQGVNFRYFTRQEASRRKLSGWVLNRSDGGVEVVAEGPRPALEGLLAFLRQGPPSASVGDLQSTWSKATGEFAQFEVRW